MNWKKRIVSLALAAVIGLSTFLASGVEAEAAGAIAKGIDVSKYQGAINWSAVAAEGYSFAFIGRQRQERPGSLFCRQHGGSQW